MEILGRLPEELHWNVIKYCVHPLASMYKSNVEITLGIDNDDTILPMEIHWDNGWYYSDHGYNFTRQFKKVVYNVDINQDEVNDFIEKYSWRHLQAIRNKYRYHDLTAFDQDLMNENAIEKYEEFVHKKHWKIYFEQLEDSVRRMSEPDDHGMIHYYDSDSDFSN